jgi:hypothetical protein
MEYCRSLKFDEEPNYDVAVGFFETCAAQHDLDLNVFDYTWKKNKLDKEKENLRAGLATLISKTPRGRETKPLIPKPEKIENEWKVDENEWNVA